MKSLSLAAPGERLSVLCLGAHSDDIEIGAGATILSLIESGVELHVHWCVLSGMGERREEAEGSAAQFLEHAAGKHVEVLKFSDGFFPQEAAPIKSWFEELKLRIDPELILTHRRDDAHQDHRQVNQLTWNTFRDHQILEYEIPKWDGDVGQPNVFIPVSKSMLEAKIHHLMAHFSSQRSKQWFDPETFRGLARIRGMECRASEGYAEAFVARKLTLSLG